MFKWFYPFAVDAPGLRRCAGVIAAVLLLIGVSVSPVQAHDLTDREVESINTSMELGIAEDLIYVDYWIAVGELEARDFRALIDTNKDGIISEDEKESFLNKLGQELTYSGLRLQIDNETNISFAQYVARIDITDTASAPVAIKINFELMFDMQRLDRYEEASERVGKKHSLIFWMTNTLPKPALTKVFIGQLDGIEITYTPAQFERELTFKAGFWLKPQEYNAIQLDYVDTGKGAPKFNRPASIVNSTSFTAMTKEKLLGFLKNPATSVWLFIIALIMAFVYGAGHALAPGHGKTLVGAYLIGSRGTTGQAVWLGLIVTATHLSTVIIAGIFALSASHYINQTALAVYLGMVSGLIIIGMGIWILYQRVKYPLSLEHHHHHTNIFGGGAAHAEHQHDDTEAHEHEHDEDHEHEHQHEHEHAGGHEHTHDHEHEHHHDEEHTHAHEDEHGHEHHHHHEDAEHHHDEGPEHSHEHEHDHEHHHNDSLPLSARPSGDAVSATVEDHPAAELPKVQFKQILALGISGGLIPCPTAIVVLLAAIILKKTLWGLCLIASFSLGLAGVLIVIGILMVQGSSLLKPSRKILGMNTSTIIRVASIASPIMFTLIGVAVIINELLTSGVLIIWNPAALP